MASARQIAANRRNAQKSCGPKTEAGKQRSSMNALRHGMTARVIVLPHEDSIAYHEIRASLLESYAPANAHETMLVDQIAAGYWRTLRARRFETAMFAAGAATYKENHGKSVEPNAGHDDQVCAVWMTEIPEEKLKNYYRYDASIERQYYRAIAALEKAQAASFRREQQIERILRNADPDTIAEPSPEPPPPTLVSENGIGFTSSQQEAAIVTVGATDCPGSEVVSDPCASASGAIHEIGFVLPQGDESREAATATAAQPAENDSLIKDTTAGCGTAAPAVNKSARERMRTPAAGLPLTFRQNPGVPLALSVCVPAFQQAPPCQLSHRTGTLAGAPLRRQHS